MTGSARSEDSMDASVFLRSPLGDIDDIGVRHLNRRERRRPL